MKRLIVVIAPIALLAAACGAGGASSLGPAPSQSPSPSASSTPTPTDEPTAPARMIPYEVWFAAEGGTLFVTTRTTQATTAIGRAALTALLAGPTEAERAAGVLTVIPAGVRLLGLTISGGVATVDLSSPFDETSGTLGETLRLAQVVYTVTQFDSVKSMRLKIDGKVVEAYASHGLVLDPPPTRGTFEDLLPPILASSPAIGQRVTSPVAIAGTANVFEATVSARILDSTGREIARTFTTATCGTGCRGDYAISLRYSVTQEQPGVVEVFEVSAKDGSQINTVRIPVTLGA